MEQGLGLVQGQERRNERQGEVMNDIVTAGILVIGDEILSGRTKDKNIGFIAEYLTNLGIDLKEVRVVADDEADIIAALDALRHRYAYVFTTGGIAMPTSLPPAASVPPMTTSPLTAWPRRSGLASTIILKWWRDSPSVSRSPGN
jgi:hypothetical protein